jgi:hypothetical protein
MKRTSCSLVGLLLCLPGIALGAGMLSSFPPAGDESATFRTEVVINQLDNPCGLALRPSSERNAPQEILFAESGRGRVLGFTVENPKATREVLTGLTVAEVEPLKTRASAWSLGFVTPTKLAVYGGIKDGSDRVGVYILPAEHEPLSAEMQDHQVTIGEDEATESQPLLSGMIFGETTAYFSIGSTEVPGQIYRSGLAANRIEMPQPLLNTAESQRSRWPTGVCLSPSTKMQFVVVAFAGDMSESRDSRVAFLIPVSGKVSLDLTPGLVDVVGLAYSPSGQLYAIDLAWEDEGAGGVYRLDDVRFEGQPACRAVKVAEIARPTSLMFAPDGVLYATAWGTGGDAKLGTVVKITGEF